MAVVPLLRLRRPGQSSSTERGEGKKHSVRITRTGLPQTHYLWLLTADPSHRPLCPSVTPRKRSTPTTTRITVVPRIRTTLVGLSVTRRGPTRHPTPLHPILFSLLLYTPCNSLRLRTQTRLLSSWRLGRGPSRPPETHVYQVLSSVSWGSREVTEVTRTEETRDGDRTRNSRPDKTPYNTWYTSPITDDTNIRLPYTRIRTEIPTDYRTSRDVEVGLCRGRDTYLMSVGSVLAWDLRMTINRSVTRGWPGLLIAFGPKWQGKDYTSYRTKGFLFLPKSLNMFVWHV